MRIEIEHVLKIIFLACIAVITFLAFVPLDNAPDTGFSDKVNHIAAFALLAALAAGSYKGGYRALITGLVIYGLFIEAVQYFIPGRSCSAMDFFADICGIAAGLLLYRFMPRRAAS